MTVLVPWHKSAPWESRRKETFEALDGRPDFEYVETFAHEDYDILMRRYWDKPGELVVCEHDVVPTQSALALLQNCSESGVCAQAYELFRGEHYAHRYVLYQGTLLPHIAEGDEWADLIGFGLTRWSEEWRKAHPWPRDLRKAKGRIVDLDSRWSFYAYAHGWGPFHIHWPAVKHSTVKFADGWKKMA